MSAAALGLRPSGQGRCRPGLWRRARCLGVAGHPPTLAQPVSLRSMADMVPLQLPLACGFRGPEWPDLARK